MSKHRLPIILKVLLTLSSILLANAGFANIRHSADALKLIDATCRANPAQHQELIQLNRQIMSAKSLAEARRLALSPTNDALHALKNARNLAPFSNDIRTAESRLNNARDRILLASSQEQVADEFNGMMLAGLDNDRAAHVSFGNGGGCSYSTGEIIAIVVGMILGIIPGIILLIVLC